jgi:hypothetical protein
MAAGRTVNSVIRIYPLGQIMHSLMCFNFFDKGDMMKTSTFKDGDLVSYSLGGDFCVAKVVYNDSDGYLVYVDGVVDGELHPGRWINSHTFEKVTDTDCFQELLKD